MEKDFNLKFFVFPGCIDVCIGNEKLPTIARIYNDRSISWKRKRISEQIRKYVEGIAKTPFMAISDSQNENFFSE